MLKGYIVTYWYVTITLMLQVVYVFSAVLQLRFTIHRQNDCAKTVIIQQKVSTSQKWSVMMSLNACLLILR